jgi:hypothetical protein
MTGWSQPETRFLIDEFQARLGLLQPSWLPPGQGARTRIVSGERQTTEATRWPVAVHSSRWHAWEV